MKTHNKCKGTGKAKGHGCAEMVDVRFRKYGLGTKCCYNDWYKWWLLNTEAGKLFRERAQLRAKKSITKVRKKQDREAKENLVTYRPKLQSKVQEIARLIDIGLPCLAKQHHAPTIHGGHVYARGGNASMALNIHNIHRQGAQSNHFQNDDGLLREGVVREYGQKYMDFIGDLRRTPALKYSNLEYKEFYRIAKDIANELKKSGQTFNLEQRLEMRNRTNERIAIYEPELCRYEN